MYFGVCVWAIAFLASTLCFAGGGSSSPKAKWNPPAQPAEFESLTLLQNEIQRNENHPESTPEGRALLIVSYNGESGLYSRLMENLSDQMTRANLEPFYQRVVSLKGTQATEENLFALLRHLGERENRVVDLFIYSHGTYRTDFGAHLYLHNNNGWFQNHLQNQVEDQGVFKNLRLVYMSGCHSATLLEPWRQAGARMAVGHSHYNGLPLFFIQKFVQYWRSGRSAYHAALEAYRFAEATAQDFRPYVEDIQAASVSGNYFSSAGIAWSAPQLLGLNFDRDGRLVDHPLPPPLPLPDPSLSGIQMESQPESRLGQTDRATVIEPLGEVEVGVDNPMTFPRYDHSGFEEALYERFAQGVTEATLRVDQIPPLPQLITQVGDFLWSTLEVIFPVDLRIQGAARRYQDRVYISEVHLRSLLRPVFELSAREQEEKFGSLQILIHLLDAARSLDFKKIKQADGQTYVMAWLEARNPGEEILLTPGASSSDASADSSPDSSVDIPWGYPRALVLPERFMFRIYWDKADSNKLTLLPSLRDSERLKVLLNLRVGTEVVLKKVDFDVRTGEVQLFIGALGDWVGLVVKGNLLHPTSFTVKSSNSTLAEGMESASGLAEQIKRMTGF